jgi:hypothetical protein
MSAPACALEDDDLAPNPNFGLSQALGGLMAGED